MFPVLAGGFFTIVTNWEAPKLSLYFTKRSVFILVPKKGSAKEFQTTIHVYVLSRFSHVELFATLWAVAH